ncbi:hypothetical protein ACV4P1_000301 [Enterobacter hormaechei]|uniref:hypothetical protein n=1 Tax=Enterobacter hormaechei TaxID=158836 RepID=UPI0029DB05EB|nr:hypothetical protein [Enterobacter hormaechei]MDX7522335.1 hypothetical protein [Enterobacter hormaechei]
MTDTKNDLHQSVKEVQVLHSYHDGVTKLNKMLSEGWILLATASGQDDQGYPIHTWTIGRTQ